MKRRLIRSNSFIRGAKRLAKRDGLAVEQLFTALALLEEDAYHPRLKTHKLQGELQGDWACRFGYDLRIIFEFVNLESHEAILLHLLGTPDEVY